MKRSKKFLISIITFATVITPFNVFASQNQYENITTYQSQDTTSREGRGALITISVFVGKVLVGYVIREVINGVVIYKTGASTGEWVARALEYLEDNPDVLKVYLPDISHKNPLY